MDTSHPQCWKMSPTASGPRVQLHTGQGNICFWRGGSRAGLFLPYSSFYIVLSFICFVLKPSDRTDLACSGGDEQYYETVWMNLYSVWSVAVLAHSHTETTSQAVTYLSGELNNHTHSHRFAHSQTQPRGLAFPANSLYYMCKYCTHFWRHQSPLFLLLWCCKLLSFLLWKPTG